MMWDWRKNELKTKYQEKSKAQSDKKTSEDQLHARVRDINSFVRVERGGLRCHEKNIPSLSQPLFSAHHVQTLRHQRKGLHNILHVRPGIGVWLPAVLENRRVRVKIW